jgi:hypothetical protein
VRSNNRLCRREHADLLGEREKLGPHNLEAERGERLDDTILADDATAGRAAAADVESS